MRFASPRHLPVLAGLFLLAFGVHVANADPRKSVHMGTGDEPAAKTVQPSVSSAASDASLWEPVARFDSPRLTESSGIARSVRHPGVFWTHNDSGHPPVLFAVRLSGEVLAEIPLVGGRNVDWEDIAISADRRLYIADTGDNQVRRESYQIYELPEPDPFAKPVGSAKVTTVWQFRLPDGPANMEALFIHREQLHVITKTTRERPRVYRLVAVGAERLDAEQVATVPLAPVTAADVSADGRRLAVLSYGQVAVFELGETLRAIADAEPKRVSIPLNLQTEACCFDGDDIIITAESGRVWRVTARQIEAESIYVGPLSDEHP